MPLPRRSVWSGSKRPAPAPAGRRFLPLDVAAGHAVQQVFIVCRLASGRQLGRKIGLTDRKVQAQLGVDQPDFGVLFDDMAVAAGHSVDVIRLLQPRIEAELAVLGEELHGAEPSAERLRGAVTGVVAAQEIGADCLGTRLRPSPGRPPPPVTSDSRCAAATPS